MTVGLVHAWAKCHDCDFEADYYKNAQALGAKHSYRTGHHVYGELGMFFEYGAK